MGSSPGEKDLYTSDNLGAVNSHPVSGLPTDASTLYVRLRYRDTRLGQKWEKKQAVDVMYTAADE